MASVDRKFGVAVLGVGRMGIIHTKNLVASGRARVLWLMRHNIEEAQRFADRLDHAPRCVRPEQLDLVLQDQSVDGVIVCSVTSQHEAQIKAALEAGKCVFSEKPITADVNSTRACYELAESKNLPLLCAFHRRFDPSFKSVHDQLRSGVSGRLRMLRISSHDPSTPPLSYIRTSGGIFKDSTIHDFDMALWMTGSPATRVYASGQAFHPDVREAGDLDLVVVTIEHASGAVTVIDNGRRCSHGYDQRLEAICDDGSYVVTNRPTQLTYRHSPQVSAAPHIDQGFDTRYPEAYATEMEHFLDIMAGVQDPRVSKADTLSAMLLADAAVESARTGRPVDLSV